MLAVPYRLLNKIINLLCLLRFLTNSHLGTNEFLRKTVRCQTSQTRYGWQCTEFSLGAFWKARAAKFFQWITKTLIWLRVCANWFEFVERTCKKVRFLTLRFILPQYENKSIQIYWKFYHQKKKKWKFSDKNSDIFHISAQNVDCGYSLNPHRQGGSNEYPQSIFLSRNKKK